MSPDIRPEDISRQVLEDGDVSVAILSLGCVTQDWRVFAKGRENRVVLGYEDKADYLQNPSYLGAIVGRVANRISGARFALNGQSHALNANEGANQLHGGPRGFSHQNWRIERDGTKRLRLSLTSPDGDQGFPGQIKATVTISLKGHALTYEMRATSDRETPLNLAQHNYYTLSNGAPVWPLKIALRSRRMTPVDAQMLPDGTVVATEGRFDLSGRALHDLDTDRSGLDQNFVLDGGARPAAEVCAPNGMRLRLWTDQPCLQVYTARHLTPFGHAHDGQDHAPFTGFCLEPQGFPDSLNRPEFQSVLISPDRPYHQKTTVEIAPTKQP